MHTRKSPFNPSLVDLKFFDENGLNLPMNAEKSAELLFFREDFVRADSEETGEISFPVGGFDTYVDGFIKSIDGKVVKERGFHIVLDHSHGSSALLFPRISYNFV